VIIIFIVLGLSVLGVALALVPLAAAQGPRLAGTLADIYHSVRENLRDSPSRLIRRLAFELPPVFTMAPFAGEEVDISEAMSQVWASVSLVTGGLFAGVATLLLAFLWTLERDRLVRSALWVLPAARRDHAREVFAEIEGCVGGYIRGVGILCLAVGSVAFAAYWLMGLPNALLLGIAAGLLEAVPVVGPLLGALPAIAVALSVDPALVWWVVGATAVIQFVENTFLVPRVMRHTVGVHPVVTMLALVGFGQLFGMAGALLAIPLAAAIQLLLDRHVLKGGSAGSTPNGRDRLSVLRIDAQELAADARRRQRDNDSDQADNGEAVEEAIEALAGALDTRWARAGTEARQTPPWLATGRGWAEIRRRTVPRGDS
jgi:predicted PurR-regulated permease PerM